jgi:hypothetical protein
MFHGSNSSHSRVQVKKTADCVKVPSSPTPVFNLYTLLSVHLNNSFMDPAHVPASNVMVELAEKASGLRSGQFVEVVDELLCTCC